jgi:hypothetical protein
MKIRTHKNNSYPGDRSIQIQAVDNTGRVLGLFNLNPAFMCGQLYWTNDNYSNEFNTITEAKEFAKTVIPKDFQDKE